MTEEKRLPITQHLTEVRQRLLRSLIGIVIGTVMAMFFGDQLIQILLQPAGEMSKQVVAIDVLEYINTYFRVSLMTGFVISMPWLLYQLFSFLSPAFTAKEKRFIFSIVPFIAIMFLSGIIFAYFVALPPAIQFLFGFGSEVVQIMPRISNYIDIVLRLLIFIGVSFEMPVLLAALGMLGVVRSDWLASKRKTWFVLAFIISAIITPTFDPVNQIIIAIPLIVLYELSIWLVRLVQKHIPKGV